MFMTADNVTESSLEMVSLSVGYSPLIRNEQDRLNPSCGNPA